MSKRGKHKPAKLAADLIEGRDHLYYLEDGRLFRVGEPLSAADEIPEPRRAKRRNTPVYYVTSEGEIARRAGRTTTRSRGSKRTSGRRRGKK